MSQQPDQQFIDDFNMAERLHRDNKLEQSLALYQNLLTRLPDQIAVLNNIGLVSEKLGNFDQAISFYQKCVAQQPDQSVFINNLANAYCRAEKWHEAQPLLKQTIDANFDHEQNCEKLALCLYNIASKQQVVTFIESVIERYPENERLNRLHGKALMYLDRHIEGLQRLRKSAGFIEFNQHGISYLN